VTNVEVGADRQPKRDADSGSFENISEFGFVLPKLPELDYIPISTLRSPLGSWFFAFFRIATFWNVALFQTTHRTRRDASTPLSSAKKVRRCRFNVFTTLVV